MIQIIDNFYSIPIDVLDLYNQCSIGGCGYGLRSPNLYDIDKTWNNNFTNFIFSQYSIDPSEHYIQSYLTFHKFDTEQSGRIHIDGRNPNVCDTKIGDYKLVRCGLIFLSDNIDSESGLSFYDSKLENNWSKEKEFDITLNECYTYNKEQLVEYNNKFNETINVKNIKNRFVSWTAGSKYKLHMTEKQQTRLIQNFYISMV